MKPRILSGARISLPPATALATLLSIAPAARAGILRWDANGSTAPNTDDGTGNWDTSTAT